MERGLGPNIDPTPSCTGNAGNPRSSQERTNGIVDTIRSKSNKILDRDRSCLVYTSASYATTLSL